MYRVRRLVGGRGGQLTAVWNVTTIPTNLAAANGTGGRWSGAGIWGSQPPVDARRKQVIFATGNIYSIPLVYVPCSQSDDPSCLPSYISRKLHPLSAGTQSTNNSLWGAASARNGSLLWQTPAPGANYSVSMPTVVGDVIVVGVTGTAGFSPPGPSALVALDKATSCVVFEYPIPGA
ncbi:hypothetical protein B0T26DRAFT_757710 [Lasiosphaeria miniovina]|uniref:Uncharacterized protein n=1 Tax=Lasiosphaeria miniovina TaxID=1954250 RepID=A0AA40DJ13_9PEZI|nr:uncharacterized protein B0T26DRAFT_757710 [Lasiosphaeria miniovina]KAK0701718.1 hypothetical protein B0T26DRAFT_757710 [Lasiosphaeria miniovina]